ncbi:carboxypeptidase regulatory-like domain-containing protein [Salmonirosea aquatica]|uniref:OmpA family protein n=1 Tax=Salmonirosea aquatica TaxID=2654236 RepID=A0A7C9BNX2_9BACT|nr:OmpA family protein [Cytophagaceae bacterium SJW1-29]
MKYFTIQLILLLLVYRGWAQSTMELADREYNSLAYLKAVTLYEEALKNPSLNKGEILSAQAKLAYSYRQLKDMPNSERVFRQLISDFEQDLPAEYVNCYLYFAQVLASNGKYGEAQETYEKYNTLNAEDRRGSKFSKLYSNVALLTKNAGSYKVEHLNMNSSAADFSPTYYKDGLVFVSGRDEALAIKRVFNWDETSFLDLYYLPNLKKIKGQATASLGGSIDPVPRIKRRWKSVLGMDAYTALTPNDSRTVGFFAGVAYNTNLGYEERPLTESQRFSKTLNTKYHEGSATFTADGNRIIFTRNNYNNNKYKTSQEGINKLKLYTAELVNGVWTNVEELPLNSDEYSSGHPALNPDNTLLYFASDRPGGLGGTDIYVSRFENGVWTEPLNAGPEINTKGNEMFPFVDPVGNLYFSSDGHAGMGDLDIFYAPMESYCKAKKSINLGAPINSNRDDFGLITDAERTTGYFSSNRKAGGIDDDIYRFSRQGPLYACRDLTVAVFDEATGEPLVNALVEIENKSNPGGERQVKTDSTGNVLLCLTAENQFTFVASREGYQNSTLGFSTEAFDDERPTSLEIPLKRTVAPRGQEPTVINNATGRVLARQGTRPLPGVVVTIKDATDGTIQNTTTDASGNYGFTAVPGHNYTLDVKSNEYGTFGKQVIGYNPATNLDLDIQMFEKGDVVKIDNIYYDLDKATIRPDAAFELNKVVEILEKYPMMRIELGSHTDSRATARYNRILSNDRAKAAREYLMSKGISADRITSKGFGESRLVNNCGDGSDCTEEEHQKNRRTEIRVLNFQ